MVGIYKFTNKLNGKIYIGQSVNIIKRKWEHISAPSPYSYFDSVLQKIGINNFDFEIVEQCPSELLNEKEKYWIKYYNCCVLDNKDGGYNLTRGGDNKQNEDNVWAKLTIQQVYDIIDDLEHSVISIQQLAKKYHVHYNTISNINRCYTWNWVHNYNSNIRLESQGNLNKGELGTNKITEQQALYIINLLKNDNRSLAQISRDENISLNIIYDINRCKTWRYLHNYNKNIRKEYKGGDI